MIIDCISDLHGAHPKLEGGDLLIVAGDLTARNRAEELTEFSLWLNIQQYKKIIVIAGNHDGLLEYSDHPRILSEVNTSHVEYLCDTASAFEGLKVWGSPWTPTFCNWYFMKPRGEAIKKKWDLIPQDTDILITHGPPWGILDEVALSSRGDKYKHAGCEELRMAVERVKPKLHVFGHIHNDGGKIDYLKHRDEWSPQKWATICVNASIMNEAYEPVNKPIRVVL